MINEICIWSSAGANVVSVKRDERSKIKIYTPSKASLERVNRMIWDLVRDEKFEMKPWLGAAAGYTANRKSKI